jgi:hypothetical protein
MVLADAVESLKQKHTEELQGLQAQAARVQELETELAKVRGAESSLRLELTASWPRREESSL